MLQTVSETAEDIEMDEQILNSLGKLKVRHDKALILKITQIIQKKNDSAKKPPVSSEKTEDQSVDLINASSATSTPINCKSMTSSA